MVRVHLVKTHIIKHSNVLILTTNSLKNSNVQIYNTTNRIIVAKVKIKFNDPVSSPVN